MNRVHARIKDNTIFAPSSSLVPPLSSSDLEETSSLGQRILSEHPGGASSSQPLGHRARRAQQTSSHPIETSEWPKEALQMLGEKALRDVREFERLWDYLLRSRTDSKCIIAAKNAIEALNSVGYSFSGKDLRGVNIPGANLSYGIFHRTNFSGANLEGVNFQCAHLENASFVGANLKKVDFGQFYLKDCDSSFYCGSSLAIKKNSREETLIAVGDRRSECSDHYCNIHLWSLERRKRISTIHTNKKSSVESIVFTVDADRVVVIQDSCIEVWNIENGALINLFSGNYILKEEILNKFPELSLKDLLRYSWVKPVLNYPDYVEVAVGTQTYQWCSERNLLEMFVFCLKKVQGIGCSVSYSRSRPLLAYANESGDVYIWDLDGIRLIRFFPGENVSQKPFFYNESHLLISNAMSVNLVDISTKEMIRTWSLHNPFVLPFENTIISPVGKYFATTSPRGVYIWSYDHQNPVMVLSQFNLLSKTRCAFSDDGKFLAVAFQGLINGSEIKIWDIRDWTMKYHFGVSTEVDGVEFADQDRSLIFTTEDGLVVWKLFESIGREVNTSLDDGIVEQLKVNPDGRRLFTVNYNGLKIWDTCSGDLFFEVKMRSRCVISSDCRYVLCYSRNRLMLWDSETRTEIITFIRDEGIKGVGFLSGARLFIIGSQMVEIYNIRTQEVYQVLDGKIPNSACYASSDNERWLAIGLENGSIAAWDSESELYYYSENDDPSRIISIKISGNTIIARNSSLFIWKPLEGRCGFGSFSDAWAIPGYPDHVLLQKGHSSVNLNSDENVCAELMVYSEDGLSYRPMYRIGLRRGKRSRNVDPHQKFLKDDWGRLKSWSKEDEDLYVEDYKSAFFLSIVVFHPTQPLLAIGGENGMIQLWNTIENRLLNVLWSHTTEVVSLSFTEDGSRLFSSSFDHTIQCWDLSSDWKIATLKWKTGPKALVLHGINTFKADLDYEDDMSLLVQRSSKIYSALRRSHLLKDLQIYVRRPHVFLPDDESESFSDIEIKSQIIDQAIVEFHQILKNEDDEEFLRIFLLKVDHLNELIPSNFRYILNAIHMVVLAVYDNTPIDPVSLTILSIISDIPVINDPMSVRELLDCHLHSVIDRLFLIPEVLSCNKTPDYAYNEAAEIFCNEKSDLNAIECYRRSLNTNPQQAEIHFRKGLLMLNRGFKEGALRDFKEAQRPGGIDFYELAVKIEEIESKL